MSILDPKKDVDEYIDRATSNLEHAGKEGLAGFVDLLTQFRVRVKVVKEEWAVDFTIDRRTTETPLVVTKPASS